MNINEFAANCIGKAGRSVTGVLHVGAHTGQEAEAYDRRGIKNVFWIEADEARKSQLLDHVAPFGHRATIAAVGAFPHCGQLHRTSDAGMSSSLFALTGHSVAWPDIVVSDVQDVPVTTLDLLHKQHDFRGLNFWVLDIQGGEADALRGARQSLACADYVLCEVCEGMYRGCATLCDIDAELPNFTAVDGWTNCDGIGEILYRRIRRSGMDLHRMTLPP